MRWSSSVNNQKEWYLYDASGERVMRRSYDDRSISIDTPGQGFTTIWPSFPLPAFFANAGGQALAFHLPKPPTQVKSVASVVANVTSGSSLQKNSPPAGDPGLGSCGLQQTSCGNYGLNYALHWGPFTLSVPGSDCLLSCGDIPGDDANLENTNDQGSGECSFTSQTKIATKKGEQSIGTIQGGEEVWAYNPKAKKMELQPILHVWLHQDNDLVDLTISSTKQGKATKLSSEVVHTNTAGCAL